MSGLGIYESLHMLHRAYRYKNRTERDEVRFMLAHDLAGKLVLDIGANAGIYSYWMSKAVGKSGRVIAFEPQPEMIDALKKLRHSFRFPQLEIAETGLSDEPGEAVLQRQMSHLGGASIARDIPGADDSFTIPLTTLDAYVEEHADRPVSFIKCDVEGHEPSVFAGGWETLRRDMPTLLFELHENQVRDSGLFQQLESIGYQVFYLHDGDKHPIDQLEAKRSQIDKPYLNYACVPSHNHE
ncbi:MAG: FkbM family methyltransferase [Phycisphaerales bacterium]